MMGEIITRNM